MTLGKFLLASAFFELLFRFGGGEGWVEREGLKFDKFYFPVGLLLSYFLQNYSDIGSESLKLESLLQKDNRSCAVFLVS